MSELDKSNVQLRTFFVGSKKLENILGLNKSVKNMGDLGNCEILMSLPLLKPLLYQTTKIKKVEVNEPKNNDTEGRKSLVHHRILQLKVQNLGHGIFPRFIAKCFNC